MNALVLFNAPVSAPDSPEWASEAGVLESVTAVTEALGGHGFHVRQLGVAADNGVWVDDLRSAPPDVVFNLVEAAGGRSSGESLVTAMLELFGVPFTGSTAECLALVHDKPRTKWLLLGAGLPTAEFVVVRRDSVLRDGLPTASLRDLLTRGRVIVKPAAEDASLGISASGVVDDMAALELQLNSLGERFGDLIVERFIDGRELNLAVVALPSPTVLPISEIEFHLSDTYRLPIVTYDAKWREESEDCKASVVRCPAVIDAGLEAEVRRLALAAFAVTGCRDYARVDFRIDAAGRPFILEVNGNPDIGPTAGLARAWRVAGNDIVDFYVGLARQATKRAGVVRRRSRRGGLNNLSLRPMVSGERSALVAIVAASPLFRADEVEVADEVLREAEHGKDSGHYRVLVADDGGPCGFACWGLVPMTDATWDLYWIAVDPKRQGEGIGGLLIEEAERRVRDEGGRWLLAETSSTTLYEPTRGFYARQGYAVVSRVADFYRPGDGRVTFGKRLDVTSAQG